MDPPDDGPSWPPRRGYRRKLIMAMWAQDVPVKEIAEAIGSTEGGVVQSIIAYRDQGYQIPYRRNDNPAWARVPHLLPKFLPP